MVVFVVLVAARYKEPSFAATAEQLALPQGLAKRQLHGASAPLVEPFRPDITDLWVPVK